MKFFNGIKFKLATNPVLIIAIIFIPLLLWSELRWAMTAVWFPLLGLVANGFENISNTWLRRGTKILFAVLALIPARYIGASLFFTAHLSPCLTCTGHFAGYEWARGKYEYVENVNCSNPSKSFRRGCEIFVNGY